MKLWKALCWAVLLEDNRKVIAAAPPAPPALVKGAPVVNPPAAATNVQNSPPLNAAPQAAAAKTAAQVQSAAPQAKAQTAAGAAPVAHPVNIPIIQLPGIVQPAAGQGMVFQVVAVAPAAKPAAPAKVASPHPAVRHDTKSSAHMLFDMLLIALCLGTIVALIYLHSSRPPVPRAVTTKLSSSYELLPTGTYGSLKNDAAIL